VIIALLIGAINTLYFSLQFPFTKEELFCLLLYTVISVQLLVFHNVSKYFLFIEHCGQPYASVKPCEGSREIATRHGRKSFESCDIQRCCKYTIIHSNENKMIVYIYI